MSSENQLKHFKNQFNSSFNVIREKTNAIFVESKKHIDNLIRLNLLLDGKDEEIDKVETIELLENIKMVLANLKGEIKDAKNELSEISESIIEAEDSMPDQYYGNELAVYNSLKAETRSNYETLSNQQETIIGLIMNGYKLIDEAQRKLYSTKIDNNELTEMVFKVLEKDPCRVKNIVESCVNEKIMFSIKPYLNNVTDTLKSDIYNSHDNLRNVFANNFVDRNDFSSFNDKIDNLEKKISVVKSELGELFSSIRRVVNDEIRNQNKLAKYTMY